MWQSPLLALVSTVGKTCLVVVMAQEAPMDHVDFLGFQICASCTQIDPIKLDGIAQWLEELTNKKQI
jgi:hypothetical protein